LFGLAVVCDNDDNDFFSSQQVEQNRVSTPMLSTPKRNGPWPTCVGMDAEQCKTMIKSNSKHPLHIEIIPEDSMVTMEVNPNRVRIRVDEDNVVTYVPDRG